MKMRMVWKMCAAGLILQCSLLLAGEKLKVLIIDGQNNHAWKETTPVLKWTLESCGRFSVTVTTTPAAIPKAPSPPSENSSSRDKEAYNIAKKRWDDDLASLRQANEDQWAKWRPEFSEYAAVVSNYNGELWPDTVRSEFENFVRSGGGFVSVHAADNAFSRWPEYNEMIGVGGWDGRDENSGARIRLSEEGKMVVDAQPGRPGRAGSHGKMHEFVVETRELEHPIMKGLPVRWRHAADELYGNLRGPAKNVTVLASATERQHTGLQNHEPILMAITYGKGRIFHTTLGHAAISMSGLGFQVTLQRGTEWAATGAVTLVAPPAHELREDEAVVREPVLPK